MSKSWKLIIVFLSLWGVTGATPGMTQPRSFNLVSEVRGTVNIKRAGYSRYQRAYGGEVLNYADRLQLGQGARVKVLCTNLAIWSLGSRGEFPVSRGCPSLGAMILPEEGGTVVRSDGDFTSPYIISPRDTAILERQPRLRWNEVEGATRYQVEVEELIPQEGRIKVIWTTQVTQTEVVYGGAERLKPEGYYWVKVRAYQGASNRGEASATFRVLSADAAQQVQADVEQLKQQSLSQAQEALALAHVYRTYQLNAAAIEVLEELVQQGNQATTVYQLLGDSYRQVGLFELAKEQYLTALEQAETEDNLDTQAQIQVSLAQIEQALDELRRAFELLQVAQANYRILGDEEKVAEIQETLEYLEERLPL